MSAAHTLLLNAGELVTLGELGPGPHRGPLRQLRAVSGGAVWMADGAIRASGLMSDVLSQIPNDADPEVIDAHGATVVPGLVDPHTHLLYQGSRTDEYPMRLAGLSYLEIGRQGGGITRTTTATREAGFWSLLTALTRRLDHLLANGTTTVEVKTGYGLSTEHELRCLDAILAAGRLHPADVIPTLLAAHAIPAEYGNNPDGYIDLIIKEILPVVAGKAYFFDVFCEDGHFDAEQASRLLRAAKRHGLRARIHADEFTDQGAAGLAAAESAIAADHLCRAAEPGLRAMAAAGVVAVLLPAARFFLLADRYADARKLLDMGIAVALGSDHSPAAPTESMLFVIGLACAELRMSPAEALTAATYNAAHALGLGERLGALTPGRQADLLVLDVHSYQDIPLHMSRPLVRTVIKRGTAHTYTV